MSKLLILCVECSAQSGSDMVYVNKVIKDCFKLNNDINIQWVYLNGKGNYKNPTVHKKILQVIKRSQADENFVIMCIDVDNFDSSPADEKLNNEIKDFCLKKDIRMVWFCKTIEDVFWDEIVSSNDKSKRVSKLKNYNIKSMCSNHLYGDNWHIRHKSNLMVELEKVLEKKD